MRQVADLKGTAINENGRLDPSELSAIGFIDENGGSSGIRLRRRQQKRN
jgi:hypothetical protein